MLKCCDRSCDPQEGDLVARRKCWPKEFGARDTSEGVVGSSWMVTGTRPGKDSAVVIRKWVSLHDGIDRTW